MTALTRDRRDSESYGPLLALGALAGNAETFYVGAMVALDADGYAVPASTATGLTVIGVMTGNAQGQSVQVINAGADGDKTLEITAGVWKMKNSAGGDEITIAEIGDDCYVVDDQTVAKTSGSSTRSVAGKVVGVESDGVLVLLGPTAWDFPLTGEITEPGVADRTALAAIPADSRYDGKMEIVRSDRSLWAFASSNTATDATQNLVVTPAAGTGRWLRVDKAVALSIPITFATADTTAIFTVPAGFTLKLAAHPYWKVGTAWTGGSSSSIGLSSSRSGYSTKGDLIAATVEAALTSGVRKGTIGDKLDSVLEMQALHLEAADTLVHDRIVSAFTAGTADVVVPVIVCDGPALS